ncbi:MAG: WbuC family cupin fold metalloprotein [Paludibacteraceae bacterium]
MQSLLNNQLLDSITEQAKESPRLRMNYNLHENLDAKAQRLLNAMEPGTLIPIHRHQQTDETYIVVRGSVKILMYDENKNLLETFILSRENGNFGYHFPKGSWHTVEILETGTVVFEVKDGPYIPFQPEDVLQ